MMGILLLVLVPLVVDEIRVHQYESSGMDLQECYKSLAESQRNPTRHYLPQQNDESQEIHRTRNPNFGTSK